MLSHEILQIEAPRLELNPTTESFKFTPDEARDITSTDIYGRFRQLMLWHGKVVTKVGEECWQCPEVVTDMEKLDQVRAQVSLRGDYSKRAPRAFSIKDSKRVEREEFPYGPHLTLRTRLEIPLEGAVRIEDILLDIGVHNVVNLGEISSTGFGSLSQSDMLFLYDLPIELHRRMVEAKIPKEPTLPAPKRVRRLNRPVPDHWTFIYQRFTTVE